MEVRAGRPFCRRKALPMRVSRYVVACSAALLAVTVSLSAQRGGAGQGPAAPRPDPHRLDMFMCDWRESMPRHSHGGLVERDILTHGDPQTSTTRCAVLAHTNNVSYATLAARGGIAPMKLDGAQEIFYVVGGKGTVTSAGETSELYDGVGILVPPGVEFSLQNTGDEDLNMYLISERVPADFRAGSKVLVSNENLQPVRGTTGHWVHIVKNIFTPADGLATLRQVITVALDPMTVGEPHAHTVGSEEVWIQIRGKSLAFIGTQLRWQTPGVGYLAPPFAEYTQENVRLGLSFPHSNINPGAEQVKFLYFQTAMRPANAAPRSAQ